MPMPARTKNPHPSVDTLNFLLEEGEEYLLNLLRLERKLRKLKPGSEEYFDLMADVEVAASVVKARMDSVIQESTDITEAMPDDD